MDRRPLHVRAIDATLRMYSHIAPTGRGGYRLARLARRFHSPDDQRAFFRTPDGLQLQLDDYLPGVTPRLIKLDIEGAEPLAISGMRETLRLHRPAVIVELNATTLARAGFPTREPYDRLLDAVPDYVPRVIAWRRKRIH